MIKIEKCHKENKRDNSKKIGEDLPEKVTFELRPEWQERIGRDNNLTKYDS